MRLLMFSAVVLAAAGAAAQSFPPPAPPAHITVSTSAGTPAPGKPVSLFVDVTPKPNIHVYAPGAAGYEPIKVTIDPQPGLTVRALRYPKSALLVNEFEKVPVYDKPFRLTQEVTLASRKAETITVKGKVDYQACDDEVCYKPATIPVTWTVTVHP